MQRRAILLVGIVAVVGAFVAFTFFGPEPVTNYDDVEIQSTSASPKQQNITVHSFGNWTNGAPGHAASGGMILFERENGSMAIQFLDFQNLAGPDVFLFLTKIPEPETKSQIEGDGVRILIPGENEGHLNARGNFVVDLPEGDWSWVRGAAAWCDSYDTLFGKIALNPPAKPSEDSMNS